MSKRRRDYDSYDNDRDHHKISTHEHFALRLNREICEIGEPGRYTVSSAVEHLGKSLGAIDDDSLRSQVLNTICAVVREQPHKIPLIGGSLQIANAANSLIGQVVIEKVNGELQNALDQKNWRYVKLFTRFAAVLTPIIDGDGVYNLLDQILTKLVLIENPSPVTNELYSAIGLTLPILYVTPASDREKVKSLYDKIKTYKTYRDERDLELEVPFVGENEKLPYIQHEFVQLLQTSLDNIDQSEWVIDSGSLGSLINMDIILSRTNSNYTGSSKHNFPALNIPESPGSVVSDKLYETTRVYQQFYIPGLFPTVPSPDSFEALLLRDLGSDIIAGMDFNRKEVARQLITLDLFFATGTFADPGITIDRLEQKFTEFTETNGSEAKVPFSTWKIEDVALEIVLDHIFRLPQTLHPQVYYHAILIETCIMAPQAIAPVFGRAVRFLFNHLEELDLELYYRFLDWFSHHLTNFAFVWKWAEWADLLEKPKTNPRYVFIQQLIVKEVRLSYPQRVRESLPVEFLALAPTDEDQELPFKYLDAGSGYEEVVGDLVAVLRKSRSTTGEKSKTDDKEEEGAEDEIAKSVETLKDKVTSDSVGGSVDALDLKMVDILTTTVCYLGNRSLSHAQDWLKLTSSLLTRHVKENPSGMTQAVDSILDYWKGQPYIGVLVLRYFVDFNVISSAVLVEKLLEQPLLLTAHGYDTLIWILKKYNAVEEIEKALENKKAEADKDLEWWFDGFGRVLSRYVELHEKKDENMEESQEEPPIEGQKEEEVSGAQKEQETADAQEVVESTDS